MSRSRTAITARHVDLVERREMRRRVLRLEQMLGDALAARRHLLARLALARRRRARRLRGGAPASRAALSGAAPAAVGAAATRSITSGLLTTPPRPVP